MFFNNYSSNPVIDARRTLVGVHALVVVAPTRPSMATRRCWIAK